jgi:hypothetical protein
MMALYLKWDKLKVLLPPCVALICINTEAGAWNREFFNSIWCDYGDPDSE